MANTYTQHYGLCQWKASDQVLRTEFNQDNTKVDQALNELAEHSASLERTIASLAAGTGNCQVYVTSYTGTGTYGKNHPCTLSFPFPPALVLVMGHFGMGLTIAGSDSLVVMSGSGGDSCNATWSDGQKTVSWFITTNETDQMNSSGWLYHVTALGTAGK